MEIYLIRHTTPKIAKEICYGQSDIALASTFREEAKGVLQELPQIGSQSVLQPAKKMPPTGSIDSAPSARAGTATSGNEFW